MKESEALLVIVIKKVNKMTRSAFFTKLIPMCFLSAEEDELGFEENEIITNIQKVRKHRLLHIENLCLFLDARRMVVW